MMMCIGCTTVGGEEDRSGPDVHARAHTCTLPHVQNPKNWASSHKEMQKVLDEEKSVFNQLESVELRKGEARRLFTIWCVRGAGLMWFWSQSVWHAMSSVLAYPQGR